MAVNGPNEWSELRGWLAARISRPVDLRPLADEDRDRVTRSLAVLPSALDEGHADAAAYAIRLELDRGGDARADALLRTHLALALVARTVEARGVTPDGRLAVLDRDRLAECRALADEIPALTADPELTAFALDLRERLDRGERWRWVAPRSVLGFAAVALAVLVLPFVGGAVGSAAVTATGVAVGGALVFGYVMAHRRRQWTVDADDAVRRPGL